MIFYRCQNFACPIKLDSCTPEIILFIVKCHVIFSMIQNLAFPIQQNYCRSHSRHIASHRYIHWLCINLQWSIWFSANCQLSASLEDFVISCLSHFTFIISDFFFMLFARFLLTSSAKNRHLIKTSRESWSNSINSYNYSASKTCRWICSQWEQRSIQELHKQIINNFNCCIMPVKSITTSKALHATFPHFNLILWMELLFWCVFEFIFMV